ncbi:DUF6474 family protein [Corynebacterium otitidis]|nr:DUF6474 family protein [Corynebacterium otitidis]EJZ81600.1 hypothetical protein HMPREF9719_01467 [Corynebacterium otitidis ATCC 51513]KKO83214.1 hypothetical protein AAV33_07720 [Corynebacterium otitidis]
MGIVKFLRKRRNKAKSEIKAATARAKAEVQSRAKREQHLQKVLAKQEKQLLRAEQKGLKAKRKHQQKMAKTELEKLKAGTINKDNVTRAIGVSRLLVPLLLPLAYRGLTALKERERRATARSYGVAPEELAKFSGYSAPHRARIYAIRKNLNEDDRLPAGFVRDMETWLDELEAPLANAEYMAPKQRRNIFRGVARDLDRVTDQVHQKLSGQRV